MPRFVIERDIPGAGRMSAADLTKASQESREALRQLGTKIQWVHSYVTGDKIYCLYIAPNEDLIREHSRLSKIPLSRIERVIEVIDPTTAEAN
jgi:hypothetical protein